MDQAGREAGLLQMTRRLGFIAALLALAAMFLLAAACSDDNGDGDGNGEPTAPATQADGNMEDDLTELSGSIRIDGSSTVGPITSAVAEEFIAATDRNVNVEVAISGTSGGFEVFCRGETQVSDASRPIKDEEVQACTDGSVVASADEIIEFQVAIDALTVMVHPDNDFVDCLTLEELYNMFREGSTVTNWSDVRPEWPDEKINFYVPGTDSGTFDYFVEAIIEEVDENGGHRGDVTASEDDNALALGIEGDENAIGYFGFAYYQEAGQALKAVSIDGGSGCVAPSFEAALDGSYVPLSRPLFIYSTSGILTERPEVLQFIKYYLENTPTLVPEVGYVTMPDDLLAEQTAKLEPFLQ
jgi:phosphate transport system substrate-binding protein